MKRLIAAILIAAPGLAMAEGEFSAGSEAKLWGLLGEEQATFESKVVDIMCELSGDCPDNCGDGGRQMGLLRSADNVLVLVNKNRQAAFTGAVEDLLPYCNQMVETDGVLIGDPEQTPAKVYMVQTIRPVGEEKWRKASRWTKVWNKAHPDLKKIKGPWFRKDPRVNTLIERDGYLGLGLETDKAFIEYYFE